MASPIRIGILNDTAAAPPGQTDIQRWLKMVADEFVGSGRLDRPVEFINSWGLGLPQGSAADVERAFKSLVDEDVLLITGPAIGDNALIATPLAEQFGVPTINWAGSERARSEWMFHLQVGSHEDESIVIAQHVAAQRLERIGIIYDKSPIGRRYHHFFMAEAEIIGLEVVATVGISPLTTDASGEIDRLTRQPLDAIVYLGLGHAVLPVARELTEIGWARPRIMNTAGIRGYFGEFAEAIESWKYLDMFSDCNITLNTLCNKLEDPILKRTGVAKGYDLGRLAMEGIARADELTRHGVKRGLELIKWLPAAEGYEGTLLGFGNQDRGALHGRYLVVRQWLNGKSVQVDA